MSKFLTFESRLVLVSMPHAAAEELADPRRAASWPATGLVVRQPLVGGTNVELFIAAPTDLLGYADIAAVTVLKPAVLPLELAEILPGRINARLKTDAASQRLSQQILAAIAAARNPSPKASGE